MTFPIHSSVRAARLAVLPLAGALCAAACVKEKGASSQGLVNSAFRGRSAELSVCWTGKALPPATLSALQAKVEEQYNARTNVRFRFTGAPCTSADLAKGSETVVVAIEKGFDMSAQGGADYDGGNCLREQSLGGVTYVFYEGISRDGSMGVRNLPRQVVVCESNSRKRANLNASYGRVGPEEALLGELSFVLLHELGHAIGLADEHIRDDIDTTSPECAKHLDSYISNWREDAASRRAVQQRIGAAYEKNGGFDASSVMAYCAPSGRSPRIGSVALSAGDVAAVNALYPRGARVESTATANPPDAPPVNPANGPAGPAGGPDVGAPSSPVTAPGSSTPTAPSPGSEPGYTTPRVIVHCDPVALRLCVLAHGGGAGCLDPDRPQRECVAQDGPGRDTFDIEAVRSCMAGKTGSEEKWTCVIP